MRWKNKEIVCPKINDRKIVFKFCFLPFRCDDNFTIWMGFRKEIFVYERYKYRLPLFKGMKSVPPIVESIGWIKEQTLSRIPLNKLSKIATQSIAVPQKK